MIRLLYSLLFICGFSTAFCQYPSTSIFSFNFEMEGDSLYLTDPKFLSGFNTTGYNNQPSFFNNREVYFSTNMYNDTLTEIAKINLSNNRLYRVTETIESEFSPTLSPDPDFFSVVRIERDGNDQSLWLYPIDRSSYGRRLMSNLKTVGYHLWLSEDEVALFLVTDPISMAIANVNTEDYKIILENIGRCLRLSQNGEIIFVHKLSSNNWYLKSYDPDLGSIKIIHETLPGKEDFEVLPDGSIIMGDGSQLYRYIDYGINAQWTKIDDLKSLGISNITRMAISQDKLLIVNVD